MSSSSIEFIPGRKKGSRNVLYDGHLYHLNRKREDKTYWKCNKCKSRLILVQDTFCSAAPHDHESQPAEIAAHRSKSKMKTLAATTENSTKQIVADSVAGLSFEASSRLNCDPKSLARLVRRARQKAYSHPVNPISLEDLVIPPNYLTSPGGDTMLLWDSSYDTDTRRSILLGTADNINIIYQSDHLVVDGTFKTSPDLFTQLFTVHALHPTGWRIPAVFGLLPGKRTIMYENILNELDSYGPFYPQSVLVDYEIAIRNAVSNVWPGTTLRQSLWRHLQSEGLAADYSSDNSPIRKSFMQIGALPFVPVSDVDQAWRLLKPSLPAEMTAFARYFESTWIGTTSTPPLFRHDSWNHHEAAQMLLPRSSNIAEGWNSGFASLVNCHNPSIWKFLECIKREQALTDVKITNILTRKPFKRAAKWEKFDLEMQRMVDDYDNFGDVTEFLKAVGSKILG
ncbi:uncharacterized protein LOC134817602 [Bolinopsis microptera]|uniref:uncharacterized protein LOC134817602 n=1 Tax=Bolinopsis microptera TaxID=2820187 RepID=UPI0030790815